MEHFLPFQFKMFSSEDMNENNFNCTLDVGALFPQRFTELMGRYEKFFFFFVMCTKQ